MAPGPYAGIITRSRFPGILLVFLLLHIFFSSSFTLIIKWAQQKHVGDVVVIGSINYIAAAAMTLPVFLVVNPMPPDWGALWTGGGMGAIYFVAYFLVIRAIRIVGAASTSVISVLSILFPIVLAAIVFSERPTNLQAVGIGLALGALALVGHGKSKVATKGDDKPQQPTAPAPARSWTVPLMLAVFFLLCGVIRVAQDLFKHVSHPDHRSAFCLTAFTIAALPSLYVLWQKKRWPTGNEYLAGTLLGLANVLQTYFMLQALQHLPGYIAFTLASGGSIVLTSFLAVSLMDERLSRKTLIGIVIAVVALVFLRWLPT